jgi:hypothetical protein
VISPDREKFKADAFGYSVQGYIQWNFLVSAMQGKEFDPHKPINSKELKNPVLWFTQAEALSHAAIAVFNSNPTFENMPYPVRGICDGQYCAAGLMLVGYSLEIVLKAMLLTRLGAEEYEKIEEKNKHHRLQDLSSFIPALTKKDKAILRGLTYFLYWAGRYPDPGSGKEKESEAIFSLSEKYSISLKDIFDLAVKVMKHGKNVIETVS